MTEQEQVRQNSKKRGVFDYLFYALAGSVLVTFSFTFLLWFNS